MKLKLQILVACLFILISFTVKSQTIIAGYNDNEVSKLQTFFAQSDGTTTNGLKDNPLYNQDNPATWTGITWDNSNPKRVTSIVFDGTLMLVPPLNIPNFTSLTTIEYNSGITPIYSFSLDITGNISLTRLSLDGQVLPSLDVSTNTALTYLSIRDNQIPNLDVTNNTALTYLDCSNSNKISSLDCSHNTALTTLKCPYCNLINLDVTHNTALTILDCTANRLISLDVTYNTALTGLYSGNNKLLSLDVTHNTSLTSLQCHDNQLTNLDVTHNTALNNLNCGYNKLTSLNIDTNKLLHSLSCEFNQLANLDVTKNTALTNLSCNNNLLTSLNLAANTNLSGLACSNNELKFSDLRHSYVEIPLLAPQRPFIPLGLDTAGGTMAVALGGTINLTAETNINSAFGFSDQVTTFHVWKKAWSGVITDVTSQCTFDNAVGSIQLPSTAGEYDSLFITMSNPTYLEFVEQTTAATALSSGMRTRLFRIVGSTFLPIELLSFTANLNNNKVDLAWSTASEKNNAFFTVERSINNQNWENIATVDGAGNSNTELNYATIDANPLSGVSYYRLKQTDFDGKFEYSKTVVIDRNVKTTIELYPNPATNQISVIGNEEDLNSIKIYNSLGQDVTKFTNYSASSSKQKQIDISKLTTGIYILKTKNTTNRLIVK